MRTLALIVVIAFAVSVEATGYTGRKSLVAAQRQGCERVKLDRQAGATGWRAEQHAHSATAANVSLPAAQRTTALRSALFYRRVADRLDRGTHIDCARVFPAASVWPWAR